MNLKPFFKLFICFILLIALSSGQAAAQFKILGSAKSKRIPFKFVKNFIIIPLKLNGKGPFNFILDTGVGVLLITDPAVKDSLKANILRNIQIAGFGSGEELSAGVTPQLDIHISEGIYGSLPAAVLKKDAFDLSSYTGMPVHGLLGYDFFSCFRVKINYQEKVLRVFKPQANYMLRNATEIPLSIEAGKPYIECFIASDAAESIPAKLIVDTGAGHPLWLENFNGNPVQLPEKHISANLGVGLTGEIDGHIGRIPLLQIGAIELKNIVTAFPEFDDAGAKITVKRSGNIGNAVLKKFTAVFDYNKKVLYLKPNSSFKQPFEHDMSGLELVWQAPEYTRMTIARVEKGSPANEAGLEEGDEILSINLKPVKEMAIDDIYSLFRSKADKAILLRIVPHGEKKSEQLILTLKRRI